MFFTKIGINDILSGGHKTAPLQFTVKLVLKNHNKQQIVISVGAGFMPARPATITFKSVSKSKTIIQEYCVILVPKKGVFGYVFLR